MSVCFRCVSCRCRCSCCWSRIAGKARLRSWCSSNSIVLADKFKNGTSTVVTQTWLSQSHHASVSTGTTFESRSHIAEKNRHRFLVTQHREHTTSSINRRRHRSNPLLVVLALTPSLPLRRIAFGRCRELFSFTLVRNCLAGDRDALLNQRLDLFGFLQSCNDPALVSRRVHFGLAVGLEHTFVGHFITLSQKQCRGKVSHQCDAVTG